MRTEEKKEKQETITRLRADFCYKNVNKSRIGLYPINGTINDKTVLVREYELGSTGSKTDTIRNANFSSGTVDNNRLTVTNVDTA